MIMVSTSEQFVPADSNVDEGYNGPVHELQLGMTVKNRDEAYDLYNKYAISKGFGIRMQKPLYKGNIKILRGYSFVYSKEGITQFTTQCREKDTLRYDTRTGCKAGITFKVEDDIWFISTFNQEHNHPFVRPEQWRFVRSGQNITDTSKDIISSMVDAGIKPMKVYAYLAKECGGVQNMGNTERDLHNFVQFRRSNLIGPGDAQSLINYFKTKLVESPLFFHHEQVDEDNMLMNVFWSDGASRADHDCFGDVVVFDTTYRTNKYDMICAPFVGVNHHWKNVYFGCAFLQNEKTTSFEWVFRTFLEAMGDKPPKTIFTDQDEAVKNAIRSVFPNSVHWLCTWHISKNATENIPHLYAKPEFKNKFNYIMNCCEVEAEFESKWKELTEEFGVSDSKWLKKLYVLCDKWSPAFNHGVFSADIRSTQMSESTNNVFQQNSGKTMTLIEFVHRYDDTVNRMREIEKEDDYKCFHGKPLLSVRDNSVFKHAANVYTHKIFKLFEDEFLQCMSCRFSEHGQQGTFKIYIVKRRKGSREHVVNFDHLELVIMCSCQKFESMGLLCRHALCQENHW